MAAKLSFIVFITVIIATYAAAEDGCHMFIDNCNPDPHICHISCEDADSAECQIVDGSSCPDFTSGAVLSADMNAAKCKELCDAETDCYYYRWDTHENPKKQFCYFMNNDQCLDVGNTKTCDLPDCKSDKADKNTCEEGGLPVKEYTCPIGTVHTPGIMPNFNLHWNCYLGDVDIDIGVGAPNKAPGNTICTAKPDCIKGGVKQIFQYKCEEDTSNPTIHTDGKWQWTGDAGAGDEDPLLVNDEQGGVLKEATCNADNLIIDDFNNQVEKGMEILCVEAPIDTTNPGSESVIAQNSCLLICDGYPVLNFYTKMSKWVYTMMDDESETPIDNPSSTGDIIFCHK